MDIWDILMEHPLAVTVVVSIISSAVFVHCLIGY